MTTSKQTKTTLKQLITGIRPTGDLTVANYLGAVVPIVKIQKRKDISSLVFVADLHALTDREPAQVREHIYNVVADYIALGIDPKKTHIYVQSVIAGELLILTALLSRHISVAEILRVPTLKDKLKANARPETANVFLSIYPILMAADILINKAELVPVGKDQLPHLEIARYLARRFNKRYGRIFPIPHPLQVKTFNILSLKGEGKMSKTNPEGAIFLTDDPDTVAYKIKGAETAFEGVMSEKLKSHIAIAKGLAQTKDDLKEIEAIIKAHQSGKPVMKDFKQAFTRIVQNFLSDFQKKREKIIKDPNYIPAVLSQGEKTARRNAACTMEQLARIFLNYN